MHTTHINVYLRGGARYPINGRRELCELVADEFDVGGDTRMSRICDAYPPEAWPESNIGCCDGGGCDGGCGPPLLVAEPVLGDEEYGEVGVAADEGKILAD